MLQQLDTKVQTPKHTCFICIHAFNLNIEFNLLEFKIQCDQHIKSTNSRTDTKYALMILIPQQSLALVMGTTFNSRHSAIKSKLV